MVKMQELVTDLKSIGMDNLLERILQQNEVDIDYDLILPENVKSSSFCIHHNYTGEPEFGAIDNNREVNNRKSLKRGLNHDATLHEQGEMHLHGRAIEVSKLKTDLPQYPSSGKLVISTDNKNLNFYKIKLDGNLFVMSSSVQISALDKFKIDKIEFLNGKQSFDLGDHVVNFFANKGYKISAKLGEGKTGQAYLAEDGNGDRAVIKLTGASPGTTMDKILAMEGPVHEAASAVSGVLQLHEYGMLESGERYVIMEHATGYSLRQLMQPDGQLDYDMKMAVIGELISTMKDIEATGKNIVHRDIKPENVILDSKGYPRIMDFGFGIMMGLDPTPDGLAVGTAAYMAPEQIMSKKLDNRADIHGLGMVIYEMLAGVNPFANEGESSAEIAQKRMTRDVTPITAYLPDADRKLTEFVHKMVAKDPNDRFRYFKDAHAAFQGIDRRQMTRVDLSRTANFYNK